MGNDPVNLIDLSGEETHYIWPDGSIHIVQTYQVQSNGVNVASNTDIEQAAEQNITGTTSNGTQVTINLVNSPDDNPIVLNGNPNLTLSGKNRSHIDKIDGRNVQLAPNAPAEIAALEIGHALGAGDQYAGGVAVGNRVLNTDVSGTQNSLMRDLGGPTNTKSLDEIVKNADKVIRIGCDQLGGIE